MPPLRRQLKALVPRALDLLTAKRNGLSWAHDLMSDDYTYAYYTQLMNDTADPYVTVRMLTDLLAAFEPGYVFVHWDQSLVYEPDPGCQKALEAERDEMLAELAKCRAALRMPEPRRYSCQN